MSTRKCTRIPGDGGRLGGGKTPPAPTPNPAPNSAPNSAPQTKVNARVKLKQKPKPAKKPLFETFTKLAVGVILINAIGWVWCSYGLAWLGRYEIAETLSQTAVSAILGVFISYAVKSAVENVNRHGLGLGAKQEHEAAEPTATSIPRDW